MKHILLGVLIIFFFYSINGTETISKSDDYMYVKGKSIPTREEVLEYHFGDELAEAKELLMRESGMNPEAINKTSGAAGLGQALPPSKMPCKLSQDWRDFACQTKWVKSYVAQRYGNFTNALAFHNENHWY